MASSSENIAVPSKRASSGLSADVAALSLGACDHDGCYLHRRGSVGILMIKVATLAHGRGKLPRGTRQWLRTVLSLDVDDPIPDASLATCKSKYPPMRALAVMTESPVICHGLKSVDMHQSNLMTAERMLFSILKTWQARGPGRTFKLVAPANGRSIARLADFPVDSHALADPAAYLYQMPEGYNDKPSQILVPPLNWRLTHEYKKRSGYALVRCTAHPQTPLIRAGIGPPSTTPRNCFARILLGPVPGGM